MPEEVGLFRFQVVLSSGMVPPGNKDDSKNKEGGMGKIGNWLAGIVAGIIVGYAVWYLTRPAPVPTPPPPPAVTIFEGMVYSGSAPVPKAMVVLDLTGDAATNGPVHDLTDENGAYRIDITGLPPAAGASLQVAAAGYRSAPPKPLSSPLQLDNRMDIALMPVPVPVSPGVAAAPVPAPVFHLPLYVRKGAAQATQARILLKK
jgi:hypothetical protein